MSRPPQAVSEMFAWPGLGPHVGGRVTGPRPVERFSTADSYPCLLKILVSLTLILIWARMPAAPLSKQTVWEFLAPAGSVLSDRMSVLSLLILCHFLPAPWRLPPSDSEQELHALLTPPCFPPQKVPFPSSSCGRKRAVSTFFEGLMLS